MIFQEIPYERITYETIEEKYKDLTKRLKEAQSWNACQKILQERRVLWEEMTPMEICMVRHDLDIADAFYAKEQDYYNEIGPKISELSVEFDEALLTSPFRKEIEEEIGSVSFAIMENAKRSISSEVLGLMQEESQLMEEYTKLTVSATVPWEGKDVERYGMTEYCQSADREIRKKAVKAVSDSWLEQKEELEQIFDKLVKNRHEQAIRLGFSNYTDNCYCSKNRIGYGKKEIEQFRNEVKKYIVPMLVKQEEKRRERLGLEHLYSYDGIFFQEGNPIPFGTTEDCLQYVVKMFSELSEETKEFIEYLMEHELYDVELRQNKHAGGYMAYLDAYKAPFILANFDGTSENAYVMTHEGGHAFQAYLKREEPIRERCQLLSEVAETHAMAMEFFTYPYMELFFGERAEDYRTMHLEQTLTRIIYQCEQDEFQQIIYEQPEMSPEERNQLWLKLEKEYFPSRDLAGNEFAEKGCGWMRIPHIYYWPFYAIEYGLAQVNALEFYHMIKQDKDKAWKSYLQFCRESGEYDFLELTKRAGLPNPFAEGAMEQLSNLILL